MYKLILCFSVWLAVRRVDTPSFIKLGSQARRGPGLGHAEPWEGVADSSQGYMRLRLGSLHRAEKETHGDRLLAWPFTSQCLASVGEWETRCAFLTRSERDSGAWRSGPLPAGRGRCMGMGWGPMDTSQYFYSLTLSVCHCTVCVWLQ